MIIDFLSLLLCALSIVGMVDYFFSVFRNKKFNLFRFGFVILVTVCLLIFFLLIALPFNCELALVLTGIQLIPWLIIVTYEYSEYTKK